MKAYTLIDLIVTMAILFIMAMFPLSYGMQTAGYNARNPGEHVSAWEFVWNGKQLLELEKARKIEAKINQEAQAQHE